MFENYFKTAFRSLIRNRNYTIINIAGLAVGTGVCMMIFIIIQFQISFEEFPSKKDRIYRVLTEYHHADPANIVYGKDVPFPMPTGLKTAFPQIEQIAPIFASRDDQLLIPDDNGTTLKQFKENKGVFFSELSFFKIFDFPLLASSYASLKEPNNVLLTKEIAEKYFGDWKTAIGKTIKLEAGVLNKEISIWGGLIKCPAVGVLKDFNDRSFRYDLAPLLITTNVTMYSQAGIKLETKNISSTA